MQVELSELELRYAGLRVRDAARTARMRASLAADGQQSAVTVIAATACAWRHCARWAATWRSPFASSSAMPMR
jgi:hypothetical protein